MNIQIANYHISDKSEVDGSGKVSLIPSRKDADHSGIFKATIRLVVFNPAVQDYPSGSVRIDVDLSDSFKGTARSTTIEQVNAHGKHTPTAVITGKCKVTTSGGHLKAAVSGYWLPTTNRLRNRAPPTSSVL